jgi:hypothetical protein
MEQTLGTKNAPRWQQWQPPRDRGIPNRLEGSWPRHLVEVFRSPGERTPIIRRLIRIALRGYFDPRNAPLELGSEGASSFRTVACGWGSQNRCLSHFHIGY